MNIQQARVLKPQEVEKLRHSLPRSLVKAAGILKGGKRVAGLRYQKQIRKEWDRRLQMLVRTPRQ